VPFTPFHFGPGLLAKAVLPRHMSFTAFVVTQVCIDVESLIHLVRSEWPVHRQLHSMLGGGVVGLGVAAVIVTARPLFLRLADRGGTVPRADLRAEAGGVAAVVGGLFGGVSHSILDAVVHMDVRPLWPMWAANPVLGVISSFATHVGCVLAGVAGIGLLWLRTRRDEKSNI